MQPVFHDRFVLVSCDRPVSYAFYGDGVSCGVSSSDFCVLAMLF